MKGSEVKGSEAKINNVEDLLQACKNLENQEDAVQKVKALLQENSTILVQASNKPKYYYHSLDVIYTPSCYILRYIGHLKNPALITAFFADTNVCSVLACSSAEAWEIGIAFIFNHKNTDPALLEAFVEGSRKVFGNAYKYADNTSRRFLIDLMNNGNVDIIKKGLELHEFQHGFRNDSKVKRLEMLKDHIAGHRKLAFVKEFFECVGKEHAFAGITSINDLTDVLKEVARNPNDQVIKYFFTQIKSVKLLKIEEKGSSSGFAKWGVKEFTLADLEAKDWYSIILSLSTKDKMRASVVEFVEHTKSYWGEGKLSSLSSAQWKEMLIAVAESEHIMCMIEPYLEGMYSEFAEIEANIETDIWIEIFQEILGKDDDCSVSWFFHVCFEANPELLEVVSANWEALVSQCEGPNVSKKLHDFAETILCALSAEVGWKKDKLESLMDKILNCNMINQRNLDSDALVNSLTTGVENGQIIFCKLLLDKFHPECFWGLSPSSWVDDIIIKIPASEIDKRDTKDFLFSIFKHIILNKSIEGIEVFFSSINEQNLDCFKSLGQREVTEVMDVVIKNYVQAVWDVFYMLGSNNSNIFDFVEYVSKTYSLAKINELYINNKSFMDNADYIKSLSPAYITYSKLYHAFWNAGSWAESMKLAYIYNFTFNTTNYVVSAVMAIPVTYALNDFAQKMLSSTHTGLWIKQHPIIATCAIGFVAVPIMHHVIACITNLMYKGAISLLELGGEEKGANFIGTAGW